MVVMYVVCFDCVRCLRLLFVFVKLCVVHVLCCVLFVFVVCV